MRFQIELELADELAAELKAAAQESNCSPARFTREVVESALAERRLPRVRLSLMSEATQALHGARVRDGGPRMAEQR